MREVKVSMEHGKTSQQVEVGPHRMVGDEEVENHGEGLGPSPFEYLAAGLGASTALAAKIYARRKGWRLENTDVRVYLIKQDDQTVFVRKVLFIGKLALSKKKQLLEFVDRCPVQKILTGKVRVDTSFLE
jgi:putative redox protein